MKTQGIEIIDGILVVPYRKAAPPAFWSRLKHEIAKRGSLDAFQADLAEEAQREGLPWEREERLFRRWVEKLGLSGPLWPWERGWTPTLVDAYLTGEEIRLPPTPHWQQAVEDKGDGE